MSEIAMLQQLGLSPLLDISEREEEHNGANQKRQWQGAFVSPEGELHSAAIVLPLPVCY